jgi:tryptophan synthase alpha chain
MNEIDKSKFKEMNRIDNLFATKRNNILSVYFTAGYPKRDDTVPVLRELEKAGADMAEIGIPFSDPMADGPVIQQSSAAALNGGMSLQLLFEQLRDVRNEVSIPLIMMSYLNPIVRFGVEEFCRSCRDTGIDGLIVPDLPFEYYIKHFKVLEKQFGLRFVMLITPETPEERIRLIDKNTSGFVYMVSTASTTGGAKEKFEDRTIDYFRRIDEMQLVNPRLVGFGISNRTTLDAAFANASGAIVGSEYVRLLATEASVGAATATLRDTLFRP